MRKLTLRARFAAFLALAIILTTTACARDINGAANFAKPHSRTGVEYRDYLSGGDLARYRDVDRFRTIDSCSFIDFAAVTREFSTPLYVGPDPAQQNLSTCNIELNPTKNPLKVASISVSADGGLVDGDVPAGRIGGVPYYSASFDTSCGAGVIAATGQLVNFTANPAGLTLATETDVPAICGEMKKLVEASLPRLTARVPPAANFSHQSSKALRVDPCVALNAVLFDYPKANTQINFLGSRTWTQRCSISLDGDINSQTRQLVDFHLVPMNRTPPGERSTLLGKSAYTDQSGRCALTVVVGQGRQPITRTSYRSIRIAVDPRTLTVDNTDFETVDYVDAVEVTADDCTLARAMAAAAAASYAQTK